MANRMSEAAPPPPAAKPAASPPSQPAPQRGIPNFGADESKEAPVAVQWDDYDAEDGGGMPTAPEGRGPNMEGTSAERPYPPVKGKKTTVNVEGTDAEEDPDAHLDAASAEGAPDPAAETAPEEEKVTIAPSARRRAALAALENEQKARSVETALIAERSKREELEKKLKTASWAELIALRGETRDDLLERLIAGKEAEGAPAPTPEQLAEASRDERIKALEKDREERIAENNRLRRIEQMHQVGEIASSVKEAPVVAAALKAGVVVDRDEQGRPLTAAEWIEGLAIAEWTKAGQPAGKQRAYVRAATEVLEDKLVEEHGDYAAALAAKRGGGTRPAPVSAPPSARTGITRRVAPRPDAREKPLPRDRDSMDQEIKRRYNLR